jgi:diaminohydroxyphosphoribosylaminopyrimidine deaminase/5-amino-6-(5-phosphoribosylamino)uracil reductase
MHKQDESYMKRAIELALLAQGRTSPNPIVGAVIVKDGKVIGEGYHHRAGTPHAEINALKEAGDLAKGATIYVTLEPCSHYGKTPPCANALVEVGVKRVVAAVLDPNPLVRGRGMEILKQASIETTVGICENQAKSINEFFFKHITTGMPFVTLKMAMTLDGKVATKNGDSKWISNEQSRSFVHELRNIYDAVMVGIGTVLKDDPRLNTRLGRMDTRNPVRVIIDGGIDLPLDSYIAKSAYSQTTILLCAAGTLNNKAEKLADKGIKIIEVEGTKDQISLEAVLKSLVKMNICSVLVEGGPEINGYLLEHKLADKIYWFIAPKLAGGRQAPSPVGGYGVEYMSDSCRVKNLELQRFGEDIMVTGYINHVL